MTPTHAGWWYYTPDDDPDGMEIITVILMRCEAGDFLYAFRAGHDRERPVESMAGTWHGKVPPAPKSLEDVGVEREARAYWITYKRGDETHHCCIQDEWPAETLDAIAADLRRREAEKEDMA